MTQRLAQIALVVDDYDRAIAWYTEKLGFTLVEDTVLSETKRWVLVAPKGSDGCRLLLARAATPHQEQAIGNQSGGRVFLFLHTDDFAQDLAAMKAKGVEFVREAERQPWGTVAVFRDLYGNLWDLIEARPNNE
ncbi:MAG TPA: VOC family protein [Flavobacteriales bacterium]|nr:VOC family protein [Flavobacteriales bacterium]MCB9179711.1 VOC family protein [Flavobacteriales bacterium]HOP45070.1 VOC family protein [Flavobacteriales bacterium]HRW91161.1 VOC family protein [Flavobacteriales bacterium]